MSDTITGTGVFDAFITNLGKYNEGELIGEWVGFPVTPEGNAGRISPYRYRTKRRVRAAL